MKINTTKPERIILSAVRQYRDFLAPTYGPLGKKVLIVENEFNHKAVDDGRQSAQSLEFRDEFENAVLQYIKETTEKTYQRVKDGTTTSALIMAAIIEEVFKDLDNELKVIDTNKISLELKNGLEEAIKKIKAKGKDIKTKDELYAISLNSFNNEDIAKLIADTVHKIGKDGVIAVEDSKGMETTCEVVQGLEIARGYASPFLINVDNTKVSLKNPLILLVNKKLETFAEIAPILREVIEAKRQVAIFAEGFSEGVINSVIAHKFMSQGNFNPLLVESAGFGDNKLDSLVDIGVLTGAKVAEVQGGVSLDKLTLNDLGLADSVEATKDKTTILGGKGKKADLNAHIEILRKPVENKFEQEKLHKRIAQLTGGIAVLRVGAYTENEQKSLKSKIDNAKEATQLAFRDGVVQGAGLTYSGIKTSSEILNNALKAPRFQLELNGKTALRDDVLDPTGVLVAALETAVSIACGLITMGGISTNKRKLDKDGNLV